MGLSMIAVKLPTIDLGVRDGVGKKWTKLTGANKFYLHVDWTVSCNCKIEVANLDRLTN